MHESDFTKQIFYRFFFPAVISSLCFALANLADALFVGIRLGDSALAAIGLVAPIWMVFNILDVGIGVGGAVTFTRLLGEGRTKRAVGVFNQLLTCVLILSISIGVLGAVFLTPILSVLGADPAQGAVYQMTRDYTLRMFLSTPLYFLNLFFYHMIRCDDGEKRAGIGLAVANLLDVGLSCVLVLGFNMGIRGAIWSTILGTAAGIVIYLPHFFLKSNIISLRLQKPQRNTVLPAFCTGFSSSSQYLWQFLLFLVLNNLLIRRHGEGALAVFNVVLNISYVVMGLFEGVGSTIQPLAATFHAERNRSAERYTVRLSFLWGVGVGAVLLMVLALFAAQIAALFGLSQSLIPMGAAALRWYALAAVAAGICVMLGAYWQAVGRERSTLALTFLRTFAVYLAAAVPLLLLCPLRYFWTVFPITELGSLLLFGAWRLFFCRRNLAFSSLDSVPIGHWMLRQDKQAISTLLEEVEEFCDRHGANMSQALMVNLAVEEICQAIFLHLNESHRQQVYIQITLFPLKDGTVELHIRDNAPAFDPFSLHTEQVSDDEQADAVMDGIGILMVQKKAKEFYYRHYQGFNTLTVRI